MQNMGPMVAQMMGGKGGGKGGRGQQAPAMDPAQVQESLEECFSGEEQAEWHRVLAEDAKRQQGIKRRPLSDAYVAGQMGKKAAKVAAPPAERLGLLLKAAKAPAARGVPAPSAELQASYVGRLVRDLEGRVRSDPDYDPARFKRTEELLNLLATQRGSEIVVEHPEEDMYS